MEEQFCKDLLDLLATVSGNIHTRQQAAVLNNEELKKSFEDMCLKTDVEIYDRIKGMVKQIHNLENKKRFGIF